MGSNAKGAVLALIAFAIFATHDVIVKAMGGIYATPQLIFFSVMFSFPLALLMLVQDPRPGTLKPVHPGWVALRTGTGIVSGLTVFYAFTALPLTQVYAIIFATPLIITILSVPFLGERVRMRRWIAVGVGLFGVLVVVRPGTAELGLGHAAALIGALCGALSAITLRKVGSKERPVVLLLYPLFGNFIVMGAALPFVYQPMPITHLGLFALMAALGLMGGLFSIQAYKHGEAVVVAPMQYSQIIWASVFGYLIFRETMDFWTTVGTLIIIGSGIYIVVREGRSDASDNHPVLRTKMRADTGTLLRPSVTDQPVNLTKNGE
ncbi:DMT family transporter [Ketogulonicigenium vulgare]|uniref:Permease, DMT superfamily protein n=1 Tax=Ketogulonicigenium vulgare (strain WSH-001) TaxID=759362 RepID=F9Y8W8_KETVW|nr:DMT family transporter [Ketogulonicigenium vulgare]ADO41793.1 Putative transporter, RhaT family, DMT superfamily protein [Ketogulonicigenium vulgare Y25]AEM40024.1 Permease, DMT superfamily protein [Ketogulonicigenium vulgare WSH-001]ALJ80229.1 hypothetical protein KVH_02985 [Ketogulonicigenium vulgare]ANW33088.1 hypothetical protein KvSKV_02980 [Ketogulonicigenium vulgare]AOZ53723.1 transporter RhaT family, DMT superfamily protein [Ketogulonicigenium vulgare]